MIGGGVAGLASAIDLAAAGVAVTVLERAAAPGGKMREVAVDGVKIDAGPTVFTMAWAFERLFADAGARLSDYATLEPAEILARHAWDGDPSGAVFDLFADPERSADAVGDLAGAAEAARFRAFCARARRIYENLETTFIDAERPGPIEMMRRLGTARTLEMLRIAPVTPLWGALGRAFKDERLRTLFARYATYCGSSPFAAPAVLMLVAYVEQAGVWRVKGGMARIAEGMARLAAELGVEIRCQAEVAEILVEHGRVAGAALATGEQLRADAIVSAVDASALGAGLFGRGAQPAARAVTPAKRSLSAVVWTAHVETSGFPLAHHSVFFPADYRAEFDAIFRRRRLPDEPTVYICAMDRGDPSPSAPPTRGPERLHILVNAPPDGDQPMATGARPHFSAPINGEPLSEAEIDRCETRMRAALERSGLAMTWRPESVARTSPAGFEQLFPGTGGALYGPANHGPLATFARPGGRTRIPGLYLAGGSAHPGPGAPMATLSGRLAAAMALSDFASEKRLRPGGISGGMSTG